MGKSGEFAFSGFLGKGERAVFKGENRCSLDDKGRFNFPAKYREEMGEAFVVTQWVDKCLIAMPLHQWERITALLQTGDLARNRKLKRLLIGGAEDVVMDKQGRILLSPELRAHGGIKKDLAVLGVGEAVEIWDVNTFEALDQQESSDELAATMEELGI